MSGRGLTLFSLMFTVAAAGSASAYFEDVAVNARAVSMGGSAAAMIQDVSAYYWNPAALSQLEGREIAIDYGRPHGVPDLSVGALAYGDRAFGTGVAVAWHRLGVAGVFAEDLFSIGAGRTVLAGPGGHRLAAGATFKFGRVSFQPFQVTDTGERVDYGALSRGSLDLALHWATPWKVDVAWVSRDLLQPEYEFIGGQGGGRLPLRQEVAVAYRWNSESTVTAGWSELDASGRGTLRLGVEVQFYDVFAIRSGLANVSNVVGSFDSPTEVQYTGGFGLYDRGWMLDAAATTNRDLGATYRLSFRFPLRFGERP